MSWDPVWEQIFRTRAWGRYPPEDLVRFVARNFYARPERSTVKILEVGCGPGSGTSWFVAREGFAVSGIDASPTAIELARERFARERLVGEFVVGDVVRMPWAEDTFDAVLDIGCLECNSESETAEILGEIHRVLRNDGVHFSMTVQAGSWGDGNGARLDATTLAEVTEGPFATMGKTRFATAASLGRLYARFRDLELESCSRTYAAGKRQVTHWLLSCRK
jgi:SAM-dependent methyltransferase